MPGNTHLLRRKGRYYLNLKVPKDVQEAFGKTVIRDSLGTSDFREAKRKRDYEVWRLGQRWEELRERTKEKQQQVQRAARVQELSDRELHEIVCTFFIDLEKETDQWWESQGRRLTGEDWREVFQDAGIEATVYSGGSENFPEENGFQLADGYLKKAGLSLSKQGESYRKLAGLFRRARLENALRKIDRLQGQSVRVHESCFEGIFAHTQIAPAKQIVTLGELLDRFLKSREKKSEVTLRTYQTPCRLLREFFGDGTSLGAITRDSMEKLFSVLGRAPTNATKRYKGKTLEQAVAEADKKEDEERFSAKTLDNYFTNINAIFNYAVEMRMIAESPVSKTFRDRFITTDEDDEPKAVFTIDELNRLFRSPLYTGCRDDQEGYAIPGSNKLRRGRFFVPLLALYHGFRCNEVCQLYTEDVKISDDGVTFTYVRKERDNGSKCEKRLKTKQSKRMVPLHPELVRLGFLDYLAERRKDVSNPRLFPELPIGSTGYYSDPFSKWFGRFVSNVLGKECEASFHSFRHMFRDALREAEVSIEDSERLGGWKLADRSEEGNYGAGPSLQRLHQKISRVTYPGLDLRHLYPPSLHPGADGGRRRILDME